ncbi:hypothetical protein B6N60_03792 [Richelia sinica FACHB-800]|uniref:Uncharacterized protein n=1 Tax=Richelia sinica FACHB-800 TaxID=1357546 RepID=A0A975TBN2_9NOST|nr:hypothetical protein [Richelia sinica]MBD2664163.1 hypothetical protein [Richelia sinica FACHB-800]QXE25082.1 hypothetical protein B6N60_03792 [Richelia sinica FACHB-800]
MNNPHSPKPSPTQTPKLSWPVWFPYPSSWLKTFILALFLRVIIFFIEHTGKVGFRVAYSSDSLELAIIILILLILSPILLVAFTHHLLHVIISRFMPEIQAPEIGKCQGIYPGLISYWEGLYAWLVILISTLVSTLFATILISIFNIDLSDPVEFYTDFEERIVAILAGIWMTTGALIYQIEFLFKRRLLLVYSEDKKEENKENLVNHIDRELNNLKGEMGMYNMQPQVSMAQPENKQVNSLYPHRKIIKQISLGLLIPLIAGGIYLFSKLPDFTVIQSAPIASQSELVSTPEKLSTENAPSSSPEIAPSTDNFRLAVNEAMGAAKLTQSAKSPDEWQEVVNQWQKAIDMMKSVPASSQNYALAQTKITEYQKNLNYAQKNAVKKYIEFTH